MNQHSKSSLTALVGLLLMLAGLAASWVRRQLHFHARSDGLQSRDRPYPANIKKRGFFGYYWSVDRQFCDLKIVSDQLEGENPTLAGTRS